MDAIRVTAPPPRRRVGLADLLTRAADLLERHGWISRRAIPVYASISNNSDYEGRLTTRGALMAAYKHLSNGYTFGRDGGPFRDETERLMGVFISPFNFPGLDEPVGIDEPGSSTAAVVAWLRECAGRVNADGFYVRRPYAPAMPATPAPVPPASVHKDGPLVLPSPHQTIDFSRPGAWRARVAANAGQDGPATTAPAVHKRKRRAVGAAAVKARLGYDPLLRATAITLDGVPVGDVITYSATPHREARRVYGVTMRHLGQEIALGGFYKPSGLFRELAERIANLESAAIAAGTLAPRPRKSRQKKAI